MSGAAAGAVAAVVPVRSLHGAKGRLAGVLADGQRERLVAAMLQDVLAVLVAHGGIDRVVVVTDDVPAAALARRCGAGVLGEPAVPPPVSSSVSPSACCSSALPRSPGLSRAVAHAAAHFAAAGFARLLFAPADVPFLTADEVGRLLATATDVALVPAADLGGTNGMLLSLPTSMCCDFGVDSFRRHLSLARAAGLSVSTVGAVGWGLDIDERADLERAAAGSGGGGETRNLVLELLPFMNAAAGS